MKKGRKPKYKERVAFKVYTERATEDRLRAYCYREEIDRNDLINILIMKQLSNYKKK